MFERNAEGDSFPRDVSGKIAFWLRTLEYEPHHMLQQGKKWAGCQRKRYQTMRLDIVYQMDPTLR